MMEMTPSTLLLWMDCGARTSVILAGQGVRKNMPTSSGAADMLRQTRLRAASAAASMGEMTSTTLSSSSGKRTWISRTMAGQAEEISGMPLCTFRFLTRCAISCETYSAPRATS